MKPKHVLTLILAGLAGLGQVVGAGARLYKSGPIQITADGQWVWSVNEDNDSVARIRVADDSVLEVVLPEPGVKDSPRGLAVREDGSEVWVACHDSDRVYVLGGEDGALLAQIDLPWGSGPYSVALSPDQQRALVTLYRSASLALLDVPNRRLVRLLQPVYWSPFGIAWTVDGQSAWVTHLFAEGEHPFLTRVDFSGPEARVATRMTVFATDPRQSSLLAAPYNIAEGGYLTMRGHPAQVPTATGLQQLWLPIQYNNISEDIYTPDSTVQAVIRRVDLTRRTIPNGVNDKVILSAVHVHNTSGNAYVGPGWNARVAGPIDIGFSADGAMTYLLNEVSDDLVVLPSLTPGVKPTGAAALPEIQVGHRPKGLAVSPVANTAYVYNQLSQDVSVIDLSALAELRRIAITPVTGNVTPAAVLQGARLFHTSNDPRVSSNGKVGCASCHINGEHDGRSWGFHRLPGPHGPREVPSLLGFARTFGPRDSSTGFGQVHRSGDRDEIQDFEHTFRSPLMSGTGFLGEMVQPELGAPNAGRDADLDALAAYVFSLQPVMRSPYRTAQGKLTEAAVRGASFFRGNNRASKRADAGCARCHVPETGFVDFKFHDVGSRRPNTEEELNTRSPAWVVNTPTLVGAWTTPPYAGVAGYAPTIHAMLEELAGRAGGANPHGSPDGLTRRQLSDLAEFVLSIDGNMTADEVRDVQDDVPPRLERVEPASLTRLELWFSESVQRNGVVDPTTWRLERADGAILPILGAGHDSIRGDRAHLTVQLQPRTRYALRVVGTILDEAATASGGIANGLDPLDPRNTHPLELGDSLTVTLGASGYEHFTIPVHDAAMVGPSLSTWDHDSVWLFPVDSGPRLNTGFVRFGWRDALIQVAGVRSSAEILAASFSLQGELGDAQAVEIRRTLQSWSDAPSGGDWNQSATGAPTWRDHAHPSAPWNSPGAGSLGGTGTNASDFNSSYDLSARVDATVTASAVNERIEFAGPMVTDAFRFWFDHPSLDYGYALRLRSGATQALKFERGETEFGAHGPVLTVTYALPLTELRLWLEGSELILAWPVVPAGFVLERADAAGAGVLWTGVPAPAIVTNGENQVRLPLPSEQTFFHLRR